MLVKLIVFLLVICVASSVPLMPVEIEADSAFTACTATKINITVYDNTKIVMNYTAVLSVRPIPSSGFSDVSITDIVLSTVDPTTYTIGTGLFPSVSVDYGTQQNCSGTCHFNVGNSTFTISFPFTIKGKTSYEGLVYNIIDEGAISYLSGDLMTSGKCDVFQNEPVVFPGILINLDQCCIKTAPVVPVTPTVKCVQYTAAVEFYRNTNKFATIYANLTYSSDKHMFTTTTTDYGADLIDYYMFTTNTYSAVMCLGTAGSHQQCDSSVFNGNFKALFQVTVATSSPTKGYYTANAGRVINRNSVLLREEGLEYTPFYPCVYMTGTFEDKTVTSTSQFCCTRFAS